MKEKIGLVLKGFIIGIANIIPGVSGGTLAITLGIYEELIGSISHFFSDWKKSFKFLLPIGIGIVFALLLFSKIISYSLDKFPIPTTLLFIGLIVGGLPLIFKKLKDSNKSKKITVLNVAILLITFTIVIMLKIMNPGSSVVDLSNIDFIGFIMLGLIGIIAAATMVIPGISGSFMLMIFGYYKPIIDTISDLASFNHIASNILVLIPFGIGVLIGIILISKIIEKLLEKFPTDTYFGIVGFIMASIITIFISLSEYSISVPSLLFGLGTFMVGCFIASKLGD